jgi:hypothetical protein
MRRLLQHRPSPSMVVALIALVVAMGGGAYAAVKLPKNSVGTKQLKNNSVTSVDVKNRSLKRRDFGRGQLPAGPTGPAGATGPRGETGPAGPFPSGNLQSGTTLRGAFSLGEFQTAPNSVSTEISFIYRLASAPTPHYIASGATPPPECPGNVATPEAAPGHLCIYEQSGSTAGDVGKTVIDPTTNTPGASRYGAVLLFGGATTDDVFGRGTWAVTAP